MESSSSPRSEQERRVGPYSLRDADRSVRIAAVLFMLVLGYAYVFAFLMVKDWSGLSPADVAATYVPAMVDTSTMREESRATTQTLNLSDMPNERHTVDTQLLVQDSHIHIMIYGIVAALQTLIILGLEWRPGWRDTMIVAAFGFGAIDFAGQWLMKAGVSAFAWLTIVSGWGMAVVYIIVLTATVRRAIPTKPRRSIP